MMFTGSRFFDNFSLRRLVEEVYPWVRTPPSCVGGSIGGGSGFVGADKSGYDKSESYSFAVYSTPENEFDEPAFLASFKSLIEKEILDSQATVLAEGNSGSAGFYFEYKWEDIAGRIVIVGKVVSNNYVLNAQVREACSGAHHSAENFSRLFQPQGEYSVVTLKGGESSGREFLETGRRMIKASIERLRSLSRDKLLDLPYAEVYTVPRVPLEVLRALEEQGQSINSVSRMNDFQESAGNENTYFLNETALRMYRDAGMKFEVLKKISADEIPAQCHRSLRGPYLP